VDDKDIQILFGVLSSQCADAFSIGVLARVGRSAGLDISTVTGTDLNRRAPILGAMERASAN
jgi:nicotinamide mononucleotide (NMN) deamidase PncC